MRKPFQWISFILLLAAGISNDAQAQYYTGIGVRGGPEYTGLSVKHFFDNDNATAVEGILGVRNNGGYVLTALYEHQTPFHNSQLQIPLSWIVGGGVHAGYFSASDNAMVGGKAKYYDDKSFAFGIDLVLGLEYQIPVAPFTVGIEFKPFYDISPRNDRWLDAAASLRYVF